MGGLATQATRSAALDEEGKPGGVTRMATTGVVAMPAC